MMALTSTKGTVRHSATLRRRGGPATQESVWKSVDPSPLLEYDGNCRGHEIPCPSTGFEMFVPGRQGRALHPIPLSGAPISVWDHAPRPFFSTARGTPFATQSGLTWPQNFPIVGRCRSTS